MTAPASSAQLNPAVVSAAVARRPTLRGVSHLVAFFLAFPAAIYQWAHAPAGLPARLAVLYGLALIALFGNSALYHRVQWSPAGYARMRRVDHSTIFAFIAGCYTPIGLLGVGGTRGTALVTICWAGALLGIVQTLFWIHAPRVLRVGLYLAIGWAGLIAIGPLWRNVGPAAPSMLLGGGVLYSLGAVVYARKRPDPFPRVFGFHEIFHLLVIIASGCLYKTVWDCLHAGA